MVKLFSGRTGNLMQAIRGKAAQSEFGHSSTGIADVNKDGYPDFVVGAALSNATGNKSGAARVFESDVEASAGSFATYGAGCAGSNGKLPRIGLAGRPALSETFAIELTTAPQSSAAVLGFDTEARSLSLGAIGLPGCSLFALHQVAIGATTASDGSLRISVDVPANAPTGSLFAQWVIVDPAANARGLVLSNAVEIVVGAP